MEIHGANTSKHIQNIENILNYGQNLNSLIIITTFPIQQAGTCNGGSETGQIDHFLPMW